MDKRDLSELFRLRLQTLLRRSEQNQATFAATVGIDRSALSQLLSGRSTRLPRAETLLAMAETHGVSLDWLLGVSQDENLIGELKPSLEIEEGPEGFDRTLLAKWHAEAAGTKIRYVPARIPDLLRTRRLIAYEADSAQRNAATELDEATYRIDYNRRPETDMEVCMPMQTLDLFAEGRGVWSGLPREARIEQLDHMAGLLEELYPSFRLFLFDGRERFSIPYTIFGPYRAAIYVGDMYMVLNTREPVRTMTRHFDGLIRIARINAHEAAAHIRKLRAL
jgi:transcriptional regulator with XRE-family HTH domain